MYVEESVAIALSIHETSAATAHLYAQQMQAVLIGWIVGASAVVAFWWRLPNPPHRVIIAVFLIIGALIVVPGSILLRTQALILWNYSDNMALEANKIVSEMKPMDNDDLKEEYHQAQCFALGEHLFQSYKPEVECERSAQVASWQTLYAPIATLLYSLGLAISVWRRSIYSKDTT